MYFIIIWYTASMQISVNLLNSVYNKVIIRAVVLRYVTRYVSQQPWLKMVRVRFFGLVGSRV